MTRKLITGGTRVRSAPTGIRQLRSFDRFPSRGDIVDGIEGFYDHRRIHSSIGFGIPDDAEGNLRAARFGVRGNWARSSARV